jgi:hypothetical protein
MCLCLVALASACANRGIGPQGGPRDTIPPLIVSERPANGTLNFDSKNIIITFDEYIRLNKISENVLMSPPQQHTPEIRTVGKRLFITFNEPLQDSTTYTINFGAAICDNNEQVPLMGYSYAFSTGNHIDSLAILGQVVNAEDLNPVSGLLVGIYPAGEDTLFDSKPFTRISLSDTLGDFAIKNVRRGDYNVLALQDVSRDFIYQPGEGLAFDEAIITPTIRTEYHMDSDSVVHGHQYWEPADLVLWFFKEDKQRHYFQRALRKEQHQFQLIFGAPQDSVPQLKAVGDIDWMQYALIQPNRTNDTIMVWITDSTYMLDTLRAEITYYASDSLYQLERRTDTIRAVYQHPNLNERTLNKLMNRKRTEALSLKTNARGMFQPNDTITINLGAPVDSLFADSIHLCYVVDSIETAVPITIEPVDDTQMKYHVIAKLQEDKDYILRIDSAAFKDIYKHATKAFKGQFKLRSVEEYSTLRILTPNYTPMMRLQLLSNQDKVIKEVPASPDGVLFEFLEPKVYYLRMYLDLNGDGKWTTGDWTTRRQPEPVFYFPARLTLRANWDFEEVFDYTATPQLDSKPQEIIKDAAAALKKK